VFGFLEDTDVGGIIRDEVAYITEGKDGVVVFVISCWIESIEKKMKFEMKWMVC
jgi:hypothetical protein